MPGPYFFFLQSQDYQYASYMPFLADAVGQSLSTRPDIIGTEISKVSLKRFSVLPFIGVVSGCTCGNEET